MFIFQIRVTHTKIVIVVITSSFYRITIIFNCIILKLKNIFHQYCIENKWNLITSKYEYSYVDSTIGIMIFIWCFNHLQMIFSCWLRFHWHRSEFCLLLLRQNHLFLLLYLHPVVFLLYLLVLVDLL